MISVRPFGDRALLAELPPGGDPLALGDAVADVRGVTEVVPAAATVLVIFDPSRTDGATLSRTIESVPMAPAGQLHGESITLHVRYDGPDLNDVARLTGLSVDEVINRHSSAQYTVAFCGFAPGFAYLTGLDPILHVPRRETPRTSVAAGSVGIAGEYTGIYPRSSPGGWQLIGRTDAVLWDAQRSSPALLPPGARVRFIRT